mmetsp:Transcript_18871/g.59068  ORF Transcript_18871/g.59068 Transcript_18871/m.59068 type:complete len:219 (+) Transcript_18871:104-760(+)
MRRRRGRESSVCPRASSAPRHRGGSVGRGASPGRRRRRRRRARPRRRGAGSGQLLGEAAEEGGSEARAVGAGASRGAVGRAERAVGVGVTALERCGLRGGVGEGARPAERRGRERRGAGRQERRRVVADGRGVVLCARARLLGRGDRQAPAALHRRPAGDPQARKAPLAAQRGAAALAASGADWPGSCGPPPPSRSGRRLREAQARGGARGGGGRGHA